MNNTARLAALEALYAQLPTIECQRKCQECCGPLAMTRLEAKRLPEFKFERGFWKTQLTNRPMGAAFITVTPHHSLVCPMLKDGACSVYSRRPAVCRLWGITEDMPCPHGCKPSVVWTKQQAAEWILAVARIGL